MLGQTQSNIEKARNSLSTLQIPKGSSIKGSDELLTPSTFTGSPSLKNPGEANMVKDKNDTFSQAQILLNAVPSSF
jgi:hypothetical protein